MAKYTLDESSTSDSVAVDDKLLEKYGEPVDLTEDQYERASAIEGVKLEEASGTTAKKTAKEE
jgi:hypothetical protein